MTFLRVKPQMLLSELLLKRHKTIMKIKLENIKEIKQIPTNLKLVGENINEPSKKKRV